MRLAHGFDVEPRPLSAIIARYSSRRLSVPDGRSPKRLRYSAEKRLTWVKPHAMASSVIDPWNSPWRNASPTFSRRDCQVSHGGNAMEDFEVFQERASRDARGLDDVGQGDWRLKVRPHVVGRAFQIARARRGRASVDRF